MLTPRYCMGYCTVDDGRYILAAGGAQDNYSHTSATEIYDTQKDKWYLLPDLNEAKYSPSVVNVKKKWIYSFGGAIL